MIGACACTPAMIQVTETPKVCGHIVACMRAGTVTLPEGVEMVMPGDNITAKFELINSVAMEPGLRFAMREGGRTVGAGVVSKVLD